MTYLAFLYLLCAVLHVKAPELTSSSPPSFLRHRVFTILYQCSSGCHHTWQQYEIWLASTFYETVTLLTANIEIKNPLDNLVLKPRPRPIPKVAPTLSPLATSVRIRPLLEQPVS
ncbi:hypothetical protein EV424DRAFT_1534179 [Suillus variegatus]|nr:hypothetical protein EV424DRAFT_1534179 [Suillus variegatus]